MPAVTVENLLVLPRVVAAPEAEPRQVQTITSSVPGYEGEGFPVNRAFAGVSQQVTDPFLMMDQMGAVDYGPGEPKGTPWHPHRGFETVTYMIDGTFQHRDSMGGGGLIQNGATQWMTAASGILHIEVPPEELVMSGGLFHGVQIWVNLPKSLKMSEPGYQAIEAEDVKLLTNADGGVLLRVIAGDIGDHKGPGSTHTPIALVHATIPAGGQLVLPWRADFNALAYVLSGQGAVGPKKAAISRSQLAVFGPGETIQVDNTSSSDLDVLFLGGQPIREPIVQYGPFVMNSRSEIEQAMKDYQSGRMGQPIN